MAQIVKLAQSPFPVHLPPLRCTVCGAQHATYQIVSESKANEATTRCLYCGRPHKLVGRRWERA